MKEGEKHKIMQKMAKTHQRLMDKKKIKAIEAKGDMSQDAVQSEEEK